VIEAEGLRALADCPFVERDDMAILSSLDVLGAQEDVDPSPDIARRDRIEALADTDPRLVVDPAAERERQLEAFLGQDAQCGQLVGELLADGGVVAEDVPGIVAFICECDELVQLCQGANGWQRDEMTPAETPDLAFDATLLVRSLLPGDAEEESNP
jgi:hypothetical protein